MNLMPIKLQPGINREGTAYSAEGGYYDGNLIRFREGLPERMGGWVKLSGSTFLGTCRMIHEFSVLAGDQYRALGTHLKLYIERGGSYNDITPIRRTVTLGSDPIETTTAGSGVIEITDTAHGALAGDFVTFSGATTVDGITTGEINKEHQITEIVDGNTYRVDTGGSASSGSTTGGGASISAAYQINTGLDTTVFGAGWGAGTYGRGAWGSAASSLTAGDKLRLWSIASFGEDIVANVRDGGVYYWDASGGVASRAVNLTALSGASNVPTVSRKILVSDESRHVVALGCNELGASDQDLLNIRWCDSENVAQWTPGTDNSAGGLRIGVGSEIVTGMKVRQEILIWTDSHLHSLRYVGAPFYFGISLVGSNVTIAGPNAAIEVDNITYWMGTGNFYAYSGKVNFLPCTVREYVFSDINFGQSEKITVGVNKQDNEVIWFYPSSGSDENNRYVIYNYKQQIWYYGSMSRTFWIDRNFQDFPVAAATDGYLYFHENGCDDGSTTPATALNAFIETGDFEIAEGYKFAFVRRIIPDISFYKSSASDPTVKITLTARNFPGVDYGSEDPQSVTASRTIPVQQYTKDVHIRVRGRAMKMRVESDGTGVFWRSGIHRLELREDGRR